MSAEILKKKQKLRNNEYYSMQEIQDKLYADSRKNKKFTNLMDMISNKENILLAYRNIKKNKGSMTKGTDGRDISYYANWSEDYFVSYIQNKLLNYFPKSVRRVEIPKPNGGSRPLGIPCMDDRIIQQCIKQILEPICEAKFHNHSYGFRPNRSTSHAIARSMFLINFNNLHYVVDIDIKGFFDNVNHGKLLKQLWNLGIRDKNLICIIGKILKSEIQGIGIPEKGTPQGGIISPLLSNIVLNELDWWLSNQWETFKTKHEYTWSHKFRALKKCKLKELFIVRYADDFKIFCRDYKTAFKIFKATKDWLLERLGLSISHEKSKITNLRKNYSEFLGFKLKAELKGKKYVCQSHIADKAKTKIVSTLKKAIKNVEKNPKASTVNNLNSIILGIHNYYKIATMCVIDFGEINFLVSKPLNNRLKKFSSKIPYKSKTYMKLYGDYNGNCLTIAGITIFPIYGCKTKTPMSFTQEINNYTVEGRALIHKQLNLDLKVVQSLLCSKDKNNTTEYIDNRISLYAGQKGTCYVSGIKLEIGHMECHHIKPKYLGGTDEYKNLKWLDSDVHKLIHATKRDTIQKYLDKLNLDDKGLKRVNTLRKSVGNLSI